MSARFGTVVLTGATSGIGEATALRLSGMAPTLVLLGLEPEQDVIGTLERIRRACTADIQYLAADFTHLSEVADAARRVRGIVPSIDLLINDAGVPGDPDRIVTPDGFERTLQVNALAPALAMVTWSSLLAREEAATSTTVVALCPGLNATPLSAAMTGGTGGPPSQGAARVLFAASAVVPSGSYLENDHVIVPSSEVLDRDTQTRLTTLFAERLTPFARIDIRTGR